MKNKQRKQQFKSAFVVAGQLFSRVACLGAVILICSSAPAQNLFMSDGYSGLARNLGGQPMKTKFKSSLCLVRHVLSRI